MDVPFRIVRTRYKLVYFLGWGALTLFLGTRVDPFVPRPLGLIIGNAAFALAVFVAVRSFRGANEPVDLPREWWRMTGTVRSAIVMASVIFAISVLGVLSLTIWSRLPQTLERLVDLSVNSVVNLALVALYINSAVRLRRSPDPVASQPVTLAGPTMGLD